MGKTLKVKPRAGFILAGIPAAGTDVEEALAREWIRNGLVVEIEEKPVPPAKRRKG